MVVNLKQIEEAQTKFTELGRTISEVSDKNVDAYEDMLKSVKELEDVATNFISKGIIENYSDTISIIDSQNEEIVNIFNTFSRRSSISLDIFSQVLQDANTQFSDLSNVASGIVADVSLKSKLKAGAPDDRTKPLTPRRGGKGGKRGMTPGSIVSGEIRSVFGRIKGIVGKLQLPTLGRVAATGMVWMGLGFQRRQRIEAEAGEMLNILEYSYEDHVKSMVGKATREMSSLQEKLQKVYGIARTEVQGVVKAFADGGLSASQMREKVDLNIKGVQDNFVTMTLAMDKVMNLAGGTSAKRAVSYMADYGKTTGEARDSLLKMYSAGMDSGIGVQQFMKNVETAGDSLKNFGFDIDDVIDLNVTLGEGFKKMNVPKQFAGRHAAMGLAQMASGISGMSNQWKMMVGEKMGYGKGIDAIIKMQEGFARVAEGGNKDELFKIISTIVGIIKQAAGGNENLMKYMMQDASGLNLGVEGADIAMRISKALDNNEVKRAKDILNKNTEKITDSFITERAKFEKWTQIMNQWMLSISKIGETLLGIVGNLLATIIVFVKSIPQFINNWLNRDTEANKRLLEGVASFTKDMSSSWDSIAKEFGKMGATATKMGATVIGSSIRNVNAALKFDPKKVLNPKAADADKKKDKGGVKFFDDSDEGGPSTSGSRVVVVPVAIPMGSEQGNYNIPMNPMSDADSKKWVGGDLSIVSTGVDQSGNINLMLNGNCPKCGLAFGSYESMQQGDMNVGSDEETLARMLRSEMGAKDFTGKRESEAVAIAYTAINRMKTNRKKYWGKSLTDVITGGHGYGEQTGDYRPYATKFAATKESRAMAKNILAGKYKDPTGGATLFYHSQGGEGFGDKKNPTALPPFTVGAVNTVNINKASFWGDQGRVTRKAEDAMEWKNREEKMFKEHKGKKG